MKIHIYNPNRTTVTINDMLGHFLALKLKTLPGTLDAHHAIRAWAQNKINEANDPGLLYVSQWLQKHMIIEIAAKSLQDQYSDLLLNGDLDHL